MATPGQSSIHTISGVRGDARTPREEQAPQHEDEPSLKASSLFFFGPENPLRLLLIALVRSRAEGGLAFTTLVQEFHNPYPEPLELIYTLPLPDV